MNTALRGSAIALLALGLTAANPASTAAFERLVDPLAGLTAPEDSIEYFRESRRAASLLAERNWAEAEAVLRRLTVDYPIDSARFVHGGNWGRLAMALRQQGKHKEAVSAYRNVIAHQGSGLSYPGGENVHYWMAVSQLASGDFEAALDTLERMVFEYGYLRRPDLSADPSFAELTDNVRFRAITGRENFTHLSRSEGWRRDLDYLIAELRRSAPHGAPVPPEVRRRKRAILDALPELSDEAVVMEMGRLLNLLERGHTGLWLGDPEAETQFAFLPIPVRFYLFPEGIYITDAAEGYEELIGARVVAFADTVAGAALRAVAAAQSNESPMQAAWLSPDMLARPAILHGLGISDRADSVELTLEMRDGTRIERTLGAGEMMLGPPGATLNPPVGATGPRFLQRTDSAHWLEPLPEQDGIYVQVNNIASGRDETMAQFGLRLRRQIEENEPRNLVLDLRHNNGGNSFTYIELLRTLVAFSTRDGNQVYVLIGRKVYSAAGNLVTDIERLVQPIFVGEPTSATGNQWGDESTFVLPYSGLTGSFAGVRWQLSHPWDDRRSIVPHVPVQQSAAAYFDGRDPVMETVFRLIAEDRRPASAVRRGRRG